MEKPKAHVQQWKKDIVAQIAEALPKYSTVAVINLENLPSRQSQQIRAKIKEHAKVIVTRKRLIKLAIERSGKDELKQLEEYMSGMPALILTNQNSFELFKILKDNMSSAAAKAGQTAPEDLIVKAGPTPFAPGPIIGELGAANIIAGIEGGKVVVKKDSVVAKEGDAISAEAASILARLDVKPMKIGLNLIAAVEKGQLYQKSILNVDVDEYIAKLKTAILDAKKLALGANILTPETIAIKLQEAHMNARKLAFGADIFCDETKEHLLKKAESHAAALKEKVPVEAPAEEAKPVEKEEKQVEEPSQNLEESNKEEETPEPKEEEQTETEEQVEEKTEEAPVEEPSQNLEESNKEEPTEEPQPEELQSTDEKSEDNQGGQ